MGVWVSYVARYRVRRRERLLTEEEFIRLGPNLAEAETEDGVAPSTVAAIRLVMLTGCQRSEILELQWDDVDLERRERRLPDSKTGPRTVPLNPPAVEVLAGLRRVASFSPIPLTRVSVAILAAACASLPSDASATEISAPCRATASRSASTSASCRSTRDNRSARRRISCRARGEKRRAIRGLHLGKLRLEPTIADAVLDRIVHNAYRIDLKGESQRKRNKPPPLDGGNDK